MMGSETCTWGVSARSARRLTQSLTANSTNGAGVMEKTFLKGERAKQRLHDIIAKQIMGKGKDGVKHPAAQQSRTFVTPRTKSTHRPTLTQEQFDLSHYQQSPCSSTPTSPKTNLKLKKTHLMKQRGSLHSLKSWKGEESPSSSPSTNLQRKKFRSEGDILAQLPSESRKKKKSTVNSQEVVRRIVDIFKKKK